MDAFNAMTANLGSSRRELAQTHFALQQSNEVSEQRRNYLETILFAGAGGGVARVDGRAHAGQGGVGGDEAGKAACLVSSQRVHGVEDEGLDTGDPLGACTQHVVENGVDLPQ